MSTVPKHYKGTTRTITFHVSLSDDESEKLELLADMLNTTKVAVIRELITKRHAELVR